MTSSIITPLMPGFSVEQFLLMASFFFGILLVEALRYRKRAAFKRMTAKMVGDLRIWSLWCCALLLPLFSGLLENRGFFVAWKASVFEVFLLIIGLSFVIPIALSSLLHLGLQKSFSLGAHLEKLILAVLFVPVYYQIFNELQWHSPYISLAAALVVSIVSVPVIQSEKLPNRIFLWMAVTSVLVPVTFLIALYRVEIFGRDTPGSSPVNATVKNKGPLVLLIFDELPVVSLLNRHGLIDENRFPNFAALGRDAVWFPRARSTAVRTSEAIPAILTGSANIPHSPVPDFHNFPLNLFSLLESSYELQVTEAATQLCPKAFKCQLDEPMSSARMLGIYSDSLLFISYRIGLEKLFELPPLTAKTHDLFGFVLKDKHPSEKLDGRMSPRFEFLDKIRSENSESTLYYAHYMLPHIPWIFYPSGKAYQSLADGMQIPGWKFKEEYWEDHNWLTLQAYQRHILQTIFTDMILGEVITKLKSAGIYKRSTLVVVGDHGLHLHPGRPRRGDSSEVLSSDDIYRIPLFLKLPNQEVGYTSLSEASHIDILPTIIDVLKIENTFETDGKSLLKSREGWVNSQEFGFNEFSNDLNQKRKIDAFSDGADPESLFRIGPCKKIYGAKVSDLSNGETSTGIVHVNNIDAFKQVSLSEPQIPGLIAGSIELRKDPDLATYIAIALNGIIWGLTESYNEGRFKKFYSVLPEHSLQQGNNAVEIFEIEASDCSIKKLQGI